MQEVKVAGPSVLKVLRDASKEMSAATRAYSDAQIQCQQTLDALIENYLNEGVFPSTPVFERIKKAFDEGGPVRATAS